VSAGGYHRSPQRETLCTRSGGLCGGGPIRRPESVWPLASQNRLCRLLHALQPTVSANNDRGTIAAGGADEAQDNAPATLQLIDKPSFGPEALKAIGEALTRPGPKSPRRLAQTLSRLQPRVLGLPMPCSQTPAKIAVTRKPSSDVHCRRWVGRAPSRSRQDLGYFVSGRRRMPSGSSTCSSATRSLML
jgi:hypothetical protein